MSEILKIIHLSGAAGIGLLCLAAILSMVKNASQWYRPLATTIAAGSGIQMVTGSLLTIYSATQGSIVWFCARIVLYSGVILLIEAFLASRMRVLDIVFPKRVLAYSMSFGFMFALVTLLK